ncbi:MAG TPA: DUF488 domain-containing protein [Anaerolineales bacterium]|nr:DUF488 domain-containing protein [Anaerolineales bacterium]
MRRSRLTVKRIYDVPRSDDGARYLVDRFWPRAVKKKDLRINAWLKEVAPSNDLRRWFAHDPAKWDEFQRRYRAELDAKPSAWEPLVEACRQGNVTLLYAARDTHHNNAIALKAYLEEVVSA